MNGNYTGPWTLDRHGLKAVFLSIAELNGYKVGTIKGKLHFGVQCWLMDKYHDLKTVATLPVAINKDSHKRLNQYLPVQLREAFDDSHKDQQNVYNQAELDRADADRAELHENIWLTRLYENLDLHFNISLASIKQKALTNRAGLKFIFSRHANATHKWQVPIELDATASMLQWNGILLNDSRLLSMTNVIVSNDKLNDAWSVPGLSRAMFKHGATPRLYGSSRAVHELWQSWGHLYTLDHIKIFNEELSSGGLGAADAFKDFLINNCKPQETMKVKIYKEEFTIEANRFKSIGDTATKYHFYDTITKSVKSVVNTKTKQVPDLEQFRRYFPTLLIHNIDSQAANYVATKAMEKYGWLIDIYDAFIVHPNMARDVRRWYSEFQQEIYDNRVSILTNFFTSIGIGSEAQVRWEQVRKLVKPCTGFKPHYMALK